MGSTFTVELPVYKRKAILSRDGSKKSIFSVQSYHFSSDETSDLGRGSVKRIPASAGANASIRTGSSRSKGSTRSKYELQSFHSSASDDPTEELLPLRSRQHSANLTGKTLEPPPLALMKTIFTIDERAGCSVVLNDSPRDDKLDLSMEETKSKPTEVFRRNSYADDLAVSLRVLIVDDAKMNRKMLCRLLKYRCDVTMEAEDGQRAVEEVASAMTRGEPFNCILMDFNMPRKDGPTAAREIRSLGYTGIIIGITGCTMPAETELFVGSGANCVLTKPLDLRELDRTILGKSSVRRIDTVF